jgi:hypothetical protein
MNIPTPYNYNRDVAKILNKNVKFEQTLCATPFIELNTTYKIIHYKLMKI